NAILLDILSEITPDNPAVPELVKAISEDLYVGRWYTTQSNAWALMALGKFFKTQEGPDYEGVIFVEGKEYKTFDIQDINIFDSTLGGKDIRISIQGAGNCYYYWQGSGVSTSGVAREFDNSLRVRREYLNANGKRLNLNSIQLGDQVVVRITAKATDKNLQNVVINDMLPACFEIENPRIKTSAKLSWLPRNSRDVSYMDVRDDRLLLFNDLRSGKEFVYYYLLRAIASGEFRIPPIAAECMYDPTISSAGSSGAITVTETD
ncbi:MAG: hypothetical protein GY855_06105, partial [candidate division Zixibacteria bacterium]|nr:hypothetical protein [candidate division Zixibacteria bacterium]